MWVSLVAGSRGGEDRATVCCGAPASHYAFFCALEHGFDNCDAWALVGLWHVESSQTRGQTHVPRVGKQILIHCTAREILN